jgi:thiamine biosynthesis lipoprotein
MAPTGADVEAAVIAFTGRALGSTVRLFVSPADDDDAGRRAADIAWREVRAELDAVDRALSRFRPDSELTALNRQSGTGGTVMVSWRLREGLAIMDRARRVTDGRFDTSVLEALERIGEHGAPLGAADVPAQPVGLERPRPVRVPASPVDSGGIGKGLALRWAAARAMSILPAGFGLLLDAGGDVVAAGEARADAWQVGIEDPLARDTDEPPITVVALARGAVATSSVRVRHWRTPDGRPVHHLIDPGTGAPATTGLLAVTVAGADPAWAEVWTKALFLTGRRGIGEEARARALAAWWVDADGRLGMTPAARMQSTWVAEDRLG